MAELCYSENALKVHRRIIAVPIAMACGMALGFFTQIEPFRSNQMLYVIGLFTVLGLTFMYFTFDASAVMPVLRVSEDSVSFHAGRSVTLLWREVLQISCENVALPDKPDSFKPRVVLLARKRDCVSSQPDRHVLDHTYGMSALALSQELQKHHHGGALSAPGLAALAIAQRGGSPAGAQRRDATGVPGQFGRRSTDRTPATDGTVPSRK